MKKTKKSRSKTTSNSLNGSSKEEFDAMSPQEFNRLCQSLGSSFLDAFSREEIDEMTLEEI